MSAAGLLSEAALQEAPVQDDSSSEYTWQTDNDRLSVCDSVRQIVLPDTSVYEGTVNRHGRPDGDGEIRLPTGEVYKGLWADGVLNEGFLALRPSNEVPPSLQPKTVNQHQRYRSGEENDKVSARTSITGQDLKLSDRSQYPTTGSDELKYAEWEYPCGDSYSGNFFVIGEPSGQGHYRWRNKSSYKGQFLCGMMDGHGKWTNADGTESYDGQWKSNLREGYGVMKFSDGAIYEGGWSKNKPNGVGHFTNPFGVVFDGQWRDGCFVPKAPHGQCIYVDEGAARETQSTNDKPIDQRVVLPCKVPGDPEGKSMPAISHHIPDDQIEISAEHPSEAHPVGQLHSKDQGGYKYLTKFIIEYIPLGDPVRKESDSDAAEQQVSRIPSVCDEGEVLPVDSTHVECLTSEQMPLDSERTALCQASSQTLEPKICETSIQAEKPRRHMNYFRFDHVLPEQQQAIATELTHVEIKQESVTHEHHYAAAPETVRTVHEQESTCKCTHQQSSNCHQGCHHSCGGCHHESHCCHGSHCHGCHCHGHCRGMCGCQGAQPQVIVNNHITLPEIKTGNQTQTVNGAYVPPIPMVPRKHTNTPSLEEEPLESPEGDLDDSATAIPQQNTVEEVITLIGRNVSPGMDMKTPGSSTQRVLPSMSPANKFCIPPEDDYAFIPLSSCRVHPNLSNNIPQLRGIPPGCQSPLRQPSTGRNGSESHEIKSVFVSQNSTTMCPNSMEGTSTVADQPERFTPIPYEYRTEVTFKLPRIRTKVINVPFPVYAPRFIEYPVPIENLSEEGLQICKEIQGQVATIPVNGVSGTDLDRVARDAVNSIERASNVWGSHLLLKAPAHLKDFGLYY